jgi:nickel-type superoxide dismutase maturation protease
VLSFFLRRVRVEGQSMMPTYQDGEVLTAIRKWRPVRVGDVVVVRDPRSPDRWLLKRCVARRGAQVDVRGDDESQSTDSRVFGTVASSSIRYVLLDARNRTSIPE